MGKRATRGDGSEREERQGGGRPDLRGLARAALVAALTAVLAQLAIPLPGSPVPVTMQVLGVLLAGFVLPPVRALQSQAIYLALGAAGLPVFAGLRGGAGVLLGPTGGYLFGFVAAAWVTAALASRLRRRARGRPGWPALMLCAAAGLACIYVPGVLQLAAVTGMPLGRAVAVGLLPFIAWDLVKAAVAAATGQALQRALSPEAEPAPAGPAPDPRL